MMIEILHGLWSGQLLKFVTHIFWQQRNLFKITFLCELYITFPVILCTPLSFTSIIFVFPYADESIFGAINETDFTQKSC